MRLHYKPHLLSPSLCAQNYELILLHFKPRRAHKERALTHELLFSTFCAPQHLNSLYPEHWARSTQVGARSTRFGECKNLNTKFLQSRSEFLQERGRERAQVWVGNVKEKIECQSHVNPCWPMQSPEDEFTRCANIARPSCARAATFQALKISLFQRLSSSQAGHRAWHPLPMAKLVNNIVLPINSSELELQTNPGRMRKTYDA